VSDAILRFVGADAGLTAQFARARAQLNQLADSANKTSGVLDKGFKVAAGAVAAISFTRLAQEAFELAENLEISSARTGIQIEALQRLQFVASQSETSVEAITTSINKFQINLAQGNEKTTKALKELGISISEINALRPDEQFLRIARSVAEIQSPAERAATAVELFGKGGTELLPLLRKGADGINEVSASFDKFGVTLSGKTISALDDAGDAISRLKGSVKSLSAELVALAAPALSKAADGMTLFGNSLAFALRGEGGGHGDNPISNLDQDIRRVREQIALLGGSEAPTSGFFAWLNRDGDVSPHNQVVALNAELRELIRQQEILTGTGRAGVSPITAIDTSILKAGLPANVRTAGSPAGPTPQDIREAGGLGSERPQITEAIAAKDLELQISQEKFEELLKQQTDYAQKTIAIDTDMAEFRRAARETFGLQEVTFERAKNETIIGLATSVFGLLARENSKLAKIQQALAIATVIYDTSRAIMRAFAEVPYPANVGVAAFAAAQGAIQIAKIRSTNYTGGGGGGGSIAGVGGGASTAGRTSFSGSSASGSEQAQPGATQRPQTTINVYGWSSGAIRELVSRIREEVGDHDLNLIRVS